MNHSHVIALAADRFIIHLRLLIAAVALTTTSSLAQADIVNNLIAHWKFDETSPGPVINEFGVDGDNGSAAGADSATAATINQPGAIGQAYQFDSEGDIVGTNLTNILSSSSDFSIFAWIKWDTRVDPDPNPLDNDQFYIFSNYVAGDPGRTIIQVINGKLGFGIESNTFGGNTDVADGQWHMVGVTHSNGGYKLLVDGVIDIEPVQISADIGTSREWVIGRRTGDLNRSFAGLIDDVRIYDRVLDTATDVQELYALGTVDVPEPASLTILLSAVLLLLFRRKR